MELLEKYLQAVKFWLPSAQQNDIIAELRDDIRSEVEERENSLGRSLNENEWEFLLKQRGRPLLVAEKYLPQRSLIGPVLFPAYWFVLRLALLCYFLPWIAVWMGLVLFSPEYRAHHLGLGAIKDISFLFFNIPFVFAVVTIVFATLEQVKDKRWLTQDWSPRKLPRVRDTKRIPRANSGAELILNTIFGIWWLKILWTLTVFESGGIKLTLPPIWHKFFWAFLLLLVVNTSLSALNFIRPYWTRERHGLKAAANLLSAIVLIFIVKNFAPMFASGPVIVLQGKVVSLPWMFTFGLTIGFGIGAIVCVILTFVEVWKALKSDRAPSRLNHSVAM
ncbi:MAG TPA: hypothetical protein VJO35_15190 [Terriglobales bacterium]|nr:hypothetical protein [Terriglobales bacterium]